MTESTSNFKYHRPCKLNKIKECDVFFHTNIEKKIFCCDSHRYKWHNNLKALFKRISRLEGKVSSLETIHEEELFARIVAKDVENAPRIEDLK